VRDWNIPICRTRGYSRDLGNAPTSVGRAMRGEPGPRSRRSVARSQRRSLPPGFASAAATLIHAHAAQLGKGQKHPSRRRSNGR